MNQAKPKSKQAPAMPKPVRKSKPLPRVLVISLLTVILLAGLGLRLGGLNWGVPEAPHYRNYYQDERFVLGLLFKMDPARLNFDPGYFINPSLHYYTLLGTLGIASMFGLQLHLPVKGTELFKPSDMDGGTYRAVFVIGRLLVVLEGVLAIWLMFLIGRLLFDDRVGLFAALLTAASYPLTYQFHILTADGPAVFWLILSLYALVKLFRSPGRKLWRVLAPVGIGLALGAKYLNALMVVPYAYVLFEQSRQSRQSFFRAAVVGFLLIGAAFIVSTPYSVLASGEFLHGDSNGFGGIFGARGLLYYNNFPPSLTEPFAVTSLAALNALGLLAFALALVVLLRRRRPTDMLLLAFIVPFYLMLMYKSSSVLRHILPALPFVILACAATLAEPKLLGLRIGVAGQVVLGLLGLSWAGLSLASVIRMSRPDTRIQAERWVRENVTTETIAMPTYNPYWYTPAIDSFNIIPFNYDQRKLVEYHPDYIMLTEPEHKVVGRTDDRADAKLNMMSVLARDESYASYRRFDDPPELVVPTSPPVHYSLVRRFAEPYQLFGFVFNPAFPSIFWDFPDPTILIYRRTTQ